MDHGLAAIAIGVFFLDDGRLVTGLTLLDHGGAVALAVTIFRCCANGDAGTNRTNAYADIVCQDRGREGANRSGNKQSFPHFHPPGFTISGNAAWDALFRGNAGSRLLFVGNLFAARNSSLSPSFSGGSPDVSANAGEPPMKDFPDAAFAPDVIELMADALKASVATLPDPVNSARVTELAESILRTAKSGERDVAVLQRMALLEIQLAPRG
jgi:hypothetical protein